MSYLDAPRLHFLGAFTADPSTINNSPSNYGYNPAAASPINIALNWNPYGSHGFTIDATVTSFVDKYGNLHLSGDPDPLIGASFQTSAQGIPAKLVDLDTENQSVTRLFGLNLQLTLSGGDAPSLQGLWDNSGTLTNLWFGKVPSLGGSDNGASGAFQSVLQNIVWGELSGSPLLQQLQTAAEDGVGLSVRLTVWGYDAATTDTTFRGGLIAGTIGPQLAGEPLHIAPRLVVPTKNSQLNCAVAKVNAAGTVVTVDLGNSIPYSATEQGTAGSPLQLGTMTMVVGPNQALLGPIDYQGQQFLDTAGVVPFAIASQQAGEPLGVAIDNVLALEEWNPYIDVDGCSVYMNPQGTPAVNMPGGTASVNVWAFNFGTPAPGTEVPFKLVDVGPSGILQNGPPVNTPASALTLSSNSVTTGSDGSVALTLTAGDPGADARPNIAGQLYFLGGDWASPLTASAGTPLTVKLFSSALAGGDQLTWAAVQPILYRFYYMYGFMAGIVDLSDYTEVQENSQQILQVLSEDFNNGGYMPVTREMAAAERNLIVEWIAAGCPA